MSHWNVTLKSRAGPLEVEFRGVVADNSKEACCAAQSALSYRDYFLVINVTCAEEKTHV